MTATTVAEAVADGVLPGRVWLYSNYHCNLACSYCLTDSAPGVPKRALTAGQMTAFSAAAAALGFTALGVTGGEPFLSPGLPSTLARMAEHLPVVALTNATLFTGPRLDGLAAIAGAPVTLQVSLDSAEADVNDDVRGADNFARVVDAVPRLVEMGIPVRMATTSERLTDDEMERLCALHRDLGIPDEDHVVRPVVRRGRAAVAGTGVVAGPADLPPELTLTADGAFWSPFGPTVRDGLLDTDLLITRTTTPLRVPAEALLRLIEVRPQGDDAALNIR